jgi:hypothetical protein
MDEIAGWIAPAATTIAAMMTAANFGARFTGWGFVVFLVGSIAWSVVGFATGQQNLLWTNAFLGLVNLVGIWRWLIRKARLGDGAGRAEKHSRSSSAPNLFTGALFEDATVECKGGDAIGQSVGAMLECRTGQVSYVVVRLKAGTIGASYRAVPWGRLRVAGDGLRFDGDARELAGFDEVDPASWPTGDAMPERSRPEGAAPGDARSFAAG